MNFGGSSQSGSTNTTTRIEPPAYQLPHLTEGLQSASERFQQTQGGLPIFQGNSIVPFAPQTEQALAMTEQRALAGSPVTRGAQDLATDTLGGAYLNSNPWLDNTFMRAANATRNALDTQFATSGRNLQAQMPYRGEQLNDLATQIYGGNYQAERDRQTQMLPFAQGLAEADYNDISRLRGVGAEVEGQTGQVIDDRMNRFNQVVQGPENALDNYLRRVSLNLGQTQTTQQPLYRNRGAGALGGALGGMQIGQQFGGYGGLIGAGLGGLLGGWG